MISLISNYFLSNFLYENKPGISHDIIDGKLTIIINTTINTIIIDPSDNKSYFRIGYNNDNFWIQKKHINGNEIIYIVSHIQQCAPEYGFDNNSTKISNAFPGITHTNSIIVILRK